MCAARVYFNKESPAESAFPASQFPFPFSETCLNESKLGPPLLDKWWGSIYQREHCHAGNTPFSGVLPCCSVAQAHRGAPQAEVLFYSLVHQALKVAPYVEFYSVH